MPVGMLIAVLGLAHLALAGPWNQTFDGGMMLNLYSAAEIDTELAYILEAYPNLVQNYIVHEGFYWRNLPQPEY